MTSPGGGLARLVREGSVRGSVVQEVLRTTDRDVVVVKDHGLPNGIDEVLVGAKPGLHAGHTVDLAADLATGFDASLRVLSVSRPGDDQSSAERFVAGVREHLEDRLPADRVRVDAVAYVAGGAVKDRVATSSFVGCKRLTAPPASGESKCLLLLAVRGGQISIGEVVQMPLFDLRRHDGCPTPSRLAE